MKVVLYVEDDDDVRENVAFELRQAGLAVVEERLAEAALRSLDRHAPDLLLLDIGMPPGEISGIELLARLRESDRWRQLPVIVLSGFGSHINLDIMARLGVSAVLTKAEVTGTDMAQRIEDILSSSP
jgi:two-component system, OmpR family, response regulator